MAGGASARYAGLMAKRRTIIRAHVGEHADLVVDWDRRPHKVMPELGEWSARKPGAHRIEHEPG